MVAGHGPKTGALSSGYARQGDGTRLEPFRSDEELWKGWIKRDRQVAIRLRSRQERSPSFGYLVAVLPLNQR
jgi:hypothetical protein